MNGIVGGGVEHMICIRVQMSLIEALLVLDGVTGVRIERYCGFYK